MSTPTLPKPTPSWQLPCYLKSSSGIPLTISHSRYELSAEREMPLAATAIERAWHLDPELSEAYEALGRLELNLGNLEATEAAYKRALALKPGNASALGLDMQTW